MFKIFIPSEPPKKNKPGGESKQCIIGGIDTNSLQCNQCKNGDKILSPSFTDAITLEALEPKHVEFISPDHNLKCCYNVSTLDKCRTAAGYLLQPPHFRLPMHIDDAKRICSTFHLTLQKTPEHPIAADVIQTRVSNNHRLQIWAFENLKSSHLWFCPICWTALTCTQGQRHASEDITRARVHTDPIIKAVEYIIDRTEHRANGLNEFAGTLSTSKTALKHHLRHAHNIRQFPCELLNIYSLRADDGILHRFLHNRGYVNSSAHGALLSYWRKGNDIMPVGFNKFVYLYLYHYAQRVASASLPGISHRESQDIAIVMSRPYSKEATASDDEFVDNSHQEHPDMPLFRHDHKEAADVQAKGRKYQQANTSDYLTHEQLEQKIKEEAEIAGSDSDLSSSEDEANRYQREKKERQKRLAKQVAESLSDSDSDSDSIFKSKQRTTKRLILDDSDEED